MSLQTSASRPAGKSVGAAIVGLIVTLAIFVVVFLSFVIAPLLLLGVALVAYLVMRPRSVRATSRRARGSSDTAAHGFGAGTQ